jgi:hypothetical protein
MAASIRYGVRVHRARLRTGPPALLLAYGAMSETAIAAGVEPLAEAADWLRSYERLWTKRLAALEALLRHPDKE